MKKNTPNNIRLGLFISIGTLVLVISLYLIGSKKNLFSNTIDMHAQFYNVNGLTAGNNVRYAGIDIGTVDKVSIENDSSVTVYMKIEKKNSKYIRKNSIASVGTDGLMGNKLVNINPGSGAAPMVEDGDLLQSLKPVENDEMVRTLNQTNENLAAITGDLRKFTGRLNKDKGILKLIQDSVAAENIRLALASIRMAAENANQVTLQLNRISAGLNNGEGLAGVLLKDTVSANDLRSTISNLQQVSDSLNTVAEGLSKFATNVNNPDGLVYTLTNDTTLSSDVRNGIKNLEEGTLLLNENLKAMRSNWFFRKYFKEENKK
ncbi:MAG: MlaD family protein [Bacteroidota bacterium]|nr:MlaD family protein [Bacteroidota bacterium]